MISVPVAVVLGPLLAGFFVFLIRRWTLPATLVGIVALSGLILFLSVIPLVDADGSAIDITTWFVLGRSLTMTDQLRLALLFVYLAMGLLFVMSYWLPQGRGFVPTSLALLSPLAAALMIQPFEFGAVLLFITAGGLALLLQGSEAGSTLAAFRLLAVVAISVPFLLVAGWMLDTSRLAFLPAVSQLFLVAFVILLAGFPFHLWVAPAFNEANSLVLVVIFGLVQILVALFCLNLLADNPTVGINAQYLRLLRASAIATMILGSLLALSARSFEWLLAYLLLIDIGATLLALAFGSIVGQTAVLSDLTVRVISLTMVAVGLDLVRRQQDALSNGGDLVELAKGLAWRTPLGVTLILWGGLSLLGFPLTPGFRGRWAVIALGSENSPTAAVVLVLAMAIGTFSLTWHLARSFSRDAMVTRIPETRGGQIIAVATLVVALLLTLFPQLMLDYASRLASLF